MSTSVQAARSAAILGHYASETSICILSIYTYVYVCCICMCLCIYIYTHFLFVCMYVRINIIYMYIYIDIWMIRVLLFNLFFCFSFFWLGALQPFSGAQLASVV